MDEKRVLVVSKDAAVCSLYETFLQEGGYQALTTDSGHNAVAILRKDSGFGLLALDIAYSSEAPKPFPGADYSRVYAELRADMQELAEYRRINCPGIPVMATVPDTSTDTMEILDMFGLKEGIVKDETFGYEKFLAGLREAMSTGPQ